MRAMVVCNISIAKRLFVPISECLCKILLREFTTVGSGEVIANALKPSARMHELAMKFWTFFEASANLSRMNLLLRDHRIFYLIA